MSLAKRNRAIARQLFGARSVLRRTIFGPPLRHFQRKFKGRVVFQGHHAINPKFEAAIFQDLGSCLAALEASGAADFYGLALGFSIEIADVVQAYIQAELSGTPCWICCPPVARPDSWGHVRCPVVPILRALYGHPDSVTMWEKHCDTHIRMKSVGLAPIGGEWPSMAGRKENLEKGWPLIREGLANPPYL